MVLSVAIQPATMCEQALEFEYREPVFYAIDPATGVRRAYAPATFFATIANAVACARQHRPWERPVAEVVSLADHAASKPGNQSLG